MIAIGLEIGATLVTRDVALANQARFARRGAAFQSGSVGPGNVPVRL